MPANDPQTGAQEAAATPARCPLPKVARRLGLAAFLFFLIKGVVVWVLLPLGLLVWHMCSGE